MFDLATYHGVKPPFTYATGPRPARIAIVGEAWGKSEALLETPFVGASGQELTRLLAEAGIPRSACLLTNVFPIQPERNDIENLCVNKAEAGANYPHPPLRQGKYIHPALLGELDRLKTELETCAPNLVLALGNTACWALLGRSGIGGIRGTVAGCKLVPGLKVLPTYHPAAILRNWALRPITSADLLKAEREAQFAEIRRPERWVIVNPVLSDIIEWAKRPADIYGVDIETSRGQITMIGFARSARDAIVVPFVDLAQANHSYWPNPGDEATAWRLVQSLLLSPTPKVFQNGVYDMGYLWRQGLAVRNALEDTMLLHHSLYPELQKGLGFLGSVYSNEASWKLMRNHKMETLKKDE